MQWHLRPRTGLVVVDEHGSLTEADSAAFLFVVRVGFAHYPQRPDFPTALWWQPPNVVVVPLGVPDVFPVSALAAAKLRNSSQANYTLLFLWQFF